jgi:hypothetical protein
MIIGSLAVDSGKWYFETTVGGSGSVNLSLGIVSNLSGLTQNHLNNYFATSPNGYATFYSYDQSGDKRTGATATAYGASFTLNDVIGVAFDADAGTLTFYKNGASQGQAFTGISQYPAAPAIRIYAGYTSQIISANFGQRPFAYTPPTGFVALNTQNLPTPTISNGATVMAATTYTGTGSALTVANTVGSASFQPDLVWVKGRSGATDHALYDAVRGVQLQIESNTTTAETTETTGLTAFGSTGFTVGALAQMNTNTATYVAWQWNAGGSTVTNTSGSISAQVRANPTAGFSIVTYTTPASGAFTVGHGLGVAPRFIISRIRTIANNWYCYHVSLGNASEVVLNTTAASSATTDWNSTSPTSTVFSMGSGWAGSYSMVSYCFAAVAGYSAFGSYTGNGSADGPFVFLGFRPRFVMIKRTDTTNQWMMFDTSRSTYNQSFNYLIANLSQAEAATSGSTDTLDFLSNGFKIRATTAAENASGGTYIYACFAENPLKFANAR